MCEKIKRGKRWREGKRGRCGRKNTERGEEENGIKRSGKWLK